MYKRLIILSVIILSALGGFVWLGYHAIQMRAEGMEGARLGDFAEVAEQIRQDVKHKLDVFIQTEQKRPYTDYQYYYVPENAAPTQQQMPLLRSPLGSKLEHNLAYGYFQIEPDGKIITPYYRADQPTQDNNLSRLTIAHLNNIKQNLLPALNGSAGVFKLPSREYLASREMRKQYMGSLSAGAVKQKAANKLQAKSKSSRKKEYHIQSLQKAPQAQQIITQPRSLAMSNVAQSSDSAEQQVDFSEHEHQRAGQKTSFMQAMKKESLAESQQAPEAPRQEGQVRRAGQAEASGTQAEQSEMMADTFQTAQIQSRTERSRTPQMDEAAEQADTVQIRIEPFVPVVIPAGDARQSIFGGQVFLLRHVQIEARHFLQGFELNEKKLIDEIKKSSQRFMREGMSFELSQKESPDVAYAAILDFGFGDLVLNLMEIDPGWIGKQINQLRNWYFSIIVIVLLAVMLALGSLWRNMRAQIKLAQKKDDFISAVSHELRTPLTTIRMYSEMLEKNWVKSEDKLGEYYSNMRAESERLSRLIENVLDFSRIQKGRKKYAFTLGDINECVAGVVEMMMPYASQNGFSIKTDFQQLGQTAFDRDAVTQIVVNLLDNAIKYARDAQDKTITVRTSSDGQFILIEVEDHGPGVPHRQRKKVFEEFYRTEAEATRETAGTGLGLALVKNFAQAHNGFVEILAAKPAGAIFRVGLAVQN